MVDFFSSWCGCRLLLAMGGVDCSIRLALAPPDGSFLAVCSLSGHADWVRSLAFTQPPDPPAATQQGESAHCALPKQAHTACACLLFWHTHTCTHHCTHMHIRTYVHTHTCTQHYTSPLPLRDSTDCNWQVCSYQHGFQLVGGLNVNFVYHGIPGCSF